MVGLRSSSGTIILFLFYITAVTSACVGACLQSEGFSAFANMVSCKPPKAQHLIDQLYVDEMLSG